MIRVDGNPSGKALFRCFRAVRAQAERAHHTICEGAFSVEASAEGITDVVYRGIAVHPDRTDQGLKAVLERLENVTQVLEAGVKKLP